ncbi:peptide chain release factor 3 [Apilactobacillus ozensis]|uniref:Peptide chain release factor 3 n=1 Tax=Apilactobacillus ozensis DSM 23829 = JCM 17196 TaxID=1423781 RepID=A0A0R2AMD9_9LACO|nr:peptide chain release factor 3 [Apilactobacillus ozensis]KRM68337.1 peptide chain release factor 3 [Apilactobacillus ozensis DSM 23829 = JCM 17196]MCK8607473.1 peptide chain release factor 3 [Apilactobacillus ozensis]
MSDVSLDKSVDKRRTFAIISHPDAGKTTITEQLLLFGGIIRQAGTVKAKKSGNFAKSDWMEIEKKRGISVTSSVMQFDYAGKRINILDTPGHEDFSEDTYRTLMAVDSAVMVIDAAKGIEPQTKKLFKICKMRGIPIFTFMNKLDRDSRDPMELISQLEDVLGIEGYPMNWPIGSGKVLRGLYDRYNKRVELYRPEDKDNPYLPLDDDGNLTTDNEITEDSVYQDAKESMDLITEAGNPFDIDKIKRGDQTPVFFGSALVNFGVQTFLDAYLKFAPAPNVHETQDDEIVKPDDEEFSGFVFKIQANMNPRHRDRIAFVRVCSGKFSRGMDVTLERNQKSLRLSNVTEFMANTRENVQNAVAGDIIGLYDTGNFQIGDTIYTGKKNINFKKLPQFTPELFVKVSAKNVMKQKSFHKGINQLVQEGAVQLYTAYTTGDYILGAVGQLQFEVFQFRMQNEYNSEVVMETMGHKTARWINPDQLDEKMSSSRNILVKDVHDEPLFLFENAFAERWFKDKYPDVELTSKL